MFRPLLCVVLAITSLSLPSLKAQGRGKSATSTPAVPSSGSGVVNEAVGGALPPLTRGLSDKAALAMSRGEWKEARKLFLEILEVEPSNTLTLANLGAVEHQLGMLASARARLEMALAIHPKLQQSWLSLGMIVFEQGDLYLAVSAFARAIHEDPSDARPHQYMALVMKKLGWLDAAESEFQRSIELNPNYATAHFNLALMYLDRSPPSLEMARRHYDKSLQLGGAKDPRFESRFKELSEPEEVLVKP